MMTAASDWKIVLIDDEEDIREVLSVSLQDAGFKVKTAADGTAGVQLCREFAPQIVITDIRMPGMDGLQVLATLKQTTPQIEVIVATAFGEMDLAIRALQLDASDFITKPISDAALHLALKRAADRFTAKKQLQDYTSLLEKEKAETSQQLLKNIAFQRNLIESSMDGILACDESGIVLTFNRSMENMLGYAKAEALHAMTIAQFFAAGAYARFQEELSAEMYGGRDRLALYETRLLEKSGREIPVQVSAALLFDHKRPAGLVCFFRDLREIRKLEREISDQARILHQDKMISLGRLAASVVHEINNPLSGILNYLRLMKRVLGQGPLAEDRQEKFQRYLDLVENETQRCSQIVSSLLSFARVSPPAFGRIQIDELLNRCVLLSRHKLDLSNIRLETEIPSDLPPVTGDFNQLQQCVINLIFNAIDAMPDGGTLFLNGHVDKDRKLVTVTVKDTGRGISARDLPHIFEPFFTTKNEGYGVGLGLSTVYGMIERHKGRIMVESRPDQGAAFVIELPAAADQ
jgi:two-component system, NtrC family, sensor kinase